jgi:PAS domain S-box-containing protein
METGLRFTYVNPAVERHFSMPRESLIGKGPQELGMPPAFRSAWERAFRTGEVQAMEFEYPGPKGIKYFQASLVPHASQPGKVETVVGFVRDFTFLKNIHVELEEEVRQRTMELERINVELREEISRREKFEKALQFSTTQIIEYSRRRKLLAKRLVELLEQDRRDMAMALHDHIGQILTTLKMDLEMLRRRTLEEGARALMDSAVDKASQAMSFSRNISHELRPAMLDTLGLVPSIECLIAQIRQSSGLRDHLLPQGDHPKTRERKGTHPVPDCSGSAHQRPETCLCPQRRCHLDSQGERGAAHHRGRWKRLRSECGHVLGKRSSRDHDHEGEGCPGGGYLGH